MHHFKFALAAIAAAIFAAPAIPSAAAAGAAESGPFISYDDEAQARRQAYQQAKSLAKAGDVSGVSEYTDGVLRGYPLNTYLQYYLLQANVTPANYKAARQFVKNSGDRELSMLVTDTYASMLAREGRYRQMRSLIGHSPYGGQMPSELNVKQTARQCRWYEAELGSGHGDSRAVSFATELYARKKPYPDGCSGLISQWAAKGYLSAAASGRRFEMLYLSRRGSKSAASSAASALPSSNYAQSAQLALSVFDEPSGYATLQDRGAAVLAFRRYAVFNPNDASAAYDSFVNQFSPNGAEKLEILRTIAEGRLGWQSTLEDVKWVDANLPAAGWDEDLIEKRLRRAVWFRQWKYVAPLCDALGSRADEDAEIMYWKGRGLLNTGHKKEGRAVLRKAADDRSFFGFMAAQLLGIHPHYGNTSLKRTDQLDLSVKDNPAVARFLELYAMDDPAQAIEWREIAANTDDHTALTMAEWALRGGNDQLAISAVVAGKRWDALDYRFPLSFYSIYKTNSQRTGVPMAYLFGISRQESMLNPVVKSSAGAVGLMQLMPGTARLVSRNSGIRLGALVDPDTNIALGSEYLRQLLSRFNGNRVLASAGYNAGPGRVPRWMSHDGRRRDAAMYVSNIPFTETRGYVQRVLLYTAIYDKLITGRNVPVLTEAERYSSY
jgi:soluble lytic murein transglycosylase